MKDRVRSQQSQKKIATTFGVLVLLAVVTFACLQPGWQPTGYRVSPIVCPVNETDSRGYCGIFRGDDYVHVYHPTAAIPQIIHISRGSGPGGNDIITTTRFRGGNVITFTRTRADPYPPQNSTDAFVQAVRDRRTELYSEMGWPDPNPPAIPPLNH